MGKIINKPEIPESGRHFDIPLLPQKGYKPLEIYGDNGFIIISSYKHDKTFEENKKNFKRLKKNIPKFRFGFIPFFSTYVENIGQESENIEIVPSLFIPNYRCASEYKYPSDDSLRNTGIILAEKYDVKFFLFNPKEEENNATFINQNGEITKILKPKIISELVKEYFKEFEKEMYDKDEFGKPSKNFRFIEEYYMQIPQRDIQDALLRYGEYFFS